MSSDLFKWLQDQLSGALSSTRYRLPADPDYFTCGIYHALSSLERLTAEPAAGEEHRTSAAMGFVASQLSWYGIFAKLAEQPPGVVCRWGTFSKIEESFNGSDFGIAIQVNALGGEEGMFYNVSFFQSKNDQNKGTAVDVSPRIDIDQVGSDHKNNKQQAAAKFENWVAAKSLLRSRTKVGTDINGANLNHQIVKMAITEASLARQHVDLNKENKDPSAADSFAHYVIWPNQEMPTTVVSIESVRKILHDRHRAKKPSLTPAGHIANSVLKLDATQTFAEFISSGKIAGSPGWALVNANNVEELIKDWSAISESWMIGDSTGGLSSKLNSKLVQFDSPDPPKLSVPSKPSVPSKNKP